MPLCIAVELKKPLTEHTLLFHHCVLDIFFWTSQGHVLFAKTCKLEIHMDDCGYG